MIIWGQYFLSSDTNQEEKNLQIGILKAPEVKYDFSSTQALKGKRGITGDHQLHPLLLARVLQTSPQTIQLSSVRGEKAWNYSCQPKIHINSRQSLLLDWTWHFWFIILSRDREIRGEKAKPMLSNTPVFEGTPPNMKSIFSSEHNSIQPGWNFHLLKQLKTIECWGLEQNDITLLCTCSCHYLYLWHNTADFFLKLYKITYSKLNKTICSRVISLLANTCTESFQLIRNTYSSFI